MEKKLSFLKNCVDCGVNTLDLGRLTTWSFRVPNDETFFGMVAEHTTAKTFVDNTIIEHLLRKGQ